MNRYLLFDSIAFIILMISGGCSISDEYCCKNNDYCGETSEWKVYSCSNEKCGQCVKVDPLEIDPLILPDASIGQSDYSVTLTAKGGLLPYTWILGREDEVKLKWLTLTPGGENTAILHNSTDTNSVTLYPTEISSGLPLTITLRDGSKHGDPNNKREDNLGKVFNMTIKTKDCPHKCKKITDTENNPTANGGDTECKNDLQCNCAKQYICKLYPPSPNACVKWEEEMKCDSKCNTSATKCCVDECATLDYPMCLPSQDIGGRATVSTCGYDPIKNDGCFYKTNSLCDGNVCKDQQCGECSDLSDICDQPGATKCTDSTNKQICIKQGSCLVWSQPLLCESNKTCIGNTCGCTGCWDGVQCQQGISDIDKCGTGGIDCFTCTNDPLHCGDANDTVWKGCHDGTCKYRYEIQQDGDVYDLKMDRSWKRQIEPDIHMWADADNACSAPYRLPMIDDLVAIIETGHGSPTINTCAFPYAPAYWFWSSFGVSGSYAWAVNFENGEYRDLPTGFYEYVRCVHDGR
jgi:hypothetical protein